MPERILILAPHIDDGEFGCGATIARLIEEGYEVHYIAFSECQSTNQSYSAGDLILEWETATDILGIQHKKIYHWPTRHFYEHRQDILQTMVDYFKSTAPSLVFAPCYDIHQDHQIVHEESIRAFRKCSLYFYDIPWANPNFNAQVFWKIEERHIQKKLAAIAAYKSQQQRLYANSDVIRGLASVRGAHIGVPYAEAFMIGRSVQ